MKVSINGEMSKENENCQYSVVYHSSKTTKSFICRNTCGTRGHYFKTYPFVETEMLVLQKNEWINDFQNLERVGEKAVQRSWGRHSKHREEGPFWFSIAQRAVTGYNTAMF